MNELEEHPSLEDLTTIAGETPAPGHDERVRETVERRLANKRAGNTVYRDIDEVAAEFGFHAR